MGQKSIFMPPEQWHQSWVDANHIRAFNRSKSAMMWRVWLDRDCVFFSLVSICFTCIFPNVTKMSRYGQFLEGLDFQKFTLNLKVMDRGWRDHGWAESVYYPGNNQKIGEARMIWIGISVSHIYSTCIYTFRGVKDGQSVILLAAWKWVDLKNPYVSFFFVVFSFFLQGFLTQRPKGLISWSSQNTFKCEMFGENTWGSGVRSGSGCQQDDADTHQVGSKTCDQLLPWRIILGQICVSRWRCCRSWNRLLWDLQLSNITNPHS